MRTDAIAALGTMPQVLTGLPASIAGSAIAAAVAQVPDPNTDIDVFCQTPEAAIAVATTLQTTAYAKVSERHERLFSRWLSHGLGGWHTNSLKMLRISDDREINVVYKTIGKHPLRSLAQVLESFDFGALAVGVDLQAPTHVKDLRPYLFPDYDLAGPLPLLPQRRETWRQGFISQYQGLRELGRYSKYLDYGFDMSLVADDLAVGYDQAVAYNRDRGGDDRLMLADIYERAAECIRNNDATELRSVGQLLVSTDSLDAIMDGLPE